MYRVAERKPLVSPDQKGLQAGFNRRPLVVRDAEHDGVSDIAIGIDFVFT